jgi:hypothetical protein
MKTKEEIIKILLSKFSYVYCHSCSNYNDDSRCDECHRKYMNWSISEETAEEVAELILKD